jgi:hypothetical protein
MSAVGMVNLAANQARFRAWRGSAGIRSVDTSCERDSDVVAASGLTGRCEQKLATESDVVVGVFDVFKTR